MDHIPRQLLTLQNGNFRDFVDAFTAYSTDFGAGLPDAMEVSGT